MIICKNCSIPMINVMSFSKDRHEKFCKCPQCYDETKHRKIKDNDLEFEEILHNKMTEGIHKDGD